MSSSLSAHHHDAPIEYHHALSGPGVNLAGVEIILNLREQVGRLSRDVELLGQMLQQKIREERGVPRYHALVKVETGTIQPVEGK